MLKITRDIYKKSKGPLSYKDFKRVYDNMMQESLSQSTFSTKIVTEHLSYLGRLTLEGLQSWFLQNLAQHGEEKAREGVHRLGYDRHSLEAFRSKPMTLTVHSARPDLKLIVRDNLDIELDVTKALILAYGTTLEEREGCKVVELAHTTG